MVEKNMTAEEMFNELGLYKNKFEFGIVYAEIGTDLKNSNEKDPFYGVTFYLDENDKFVGFKEGSDLLMIDLKHFNAIKKQIEELL